MINELTTMYKQEQERFLETLSCWGSNCKGTMVPLTLKEQTIYVDSGRDTEYIIVAKCNTCGKTMSFFSYAQWVKLKKQGAKRTIANAVKERKDAKEDFAFALAKITKEFNEKKSEMAERVIEAKATLEKFKGA